MINKSAERVFEKKRQRRRRLAKLPFEKKIEIIVELQRVATAIKNDKQHKVWPI